MGYNVRKYVVVIVYGEVRKAEQKKIEDNAEGIERYQSDKYLFEYWLQVHVLSIENSNWKSISCKEKQFISPSSRLDKEHLITTNSKYAFLHKIIIIFDKITNIIRFSSIQYFSSYKSSCSILLFLIYLKNKSHRFIFMVAWFYSL